MKIVFFNRFFFPDTSATSQILSDLAFHLAEGGADVHVVTSKVPGGESALETIRGVTIHRVTRAIAGPHGLMRRALAYAGYYHGARRAARKLLDRGDIAIFKTDPPMLSSFVGAVAVRRGAKTVAWVQDIFPEIAREFGVPGMSGSPFRMLRAARNKSYRAADRVVAIGERMADRLAAEGVDRERITVIHNWADADAIRPLPREGNALRSAWNLAGKFVVAYSGNLGRVHEFDTILDAAAKLRERGDIVFVIVGRGPRHAEVRAKAEAAKLANVMFQPHQDRASLSESLGVADVHLSVLQPRFDSLVVPSKLYGIMAAGRPVIFIGDTAGESAALIGEARCGVAVRTGDSGALAEAIRDFADHREKAEAMGRDGRDAFERRFTLRHALALWSETLVGLGYRRS